MGSGEGRMEWDGEGVGERVGVPPLNFRRKGDLGVPLLYFKRESWVSHLHLGVALGPAVSSSNFFLMFSSFLAIDFILCRVVVMKK